MEIPCGDVTRVRFGRKFCSLARPSTAPLTAKVVNKLSYLERSFVFGFNASPRNSIHYVSSTVIVYPVGTVCVLHDLLKNEQRFFECHDSLVTCLTFCASTRLCASGQRDPKGTARPPILIWNADHPHSHKPTRLLSHEKSIVCLSFNSTGDTLVSIGGEDDHSILVWKEIFPSSAGRKKNENDWIGVDVIRPSVVLLGRKSPPLSILFPATGASDQFLVFGESYFEVCDITTRGCKQGVYSGRPSSTSHSFARTPHDAVLTGLDSTGLLIPGGKNSGNILALEGNVCLKSIKASETDLLCVDFVVPGKVAVVAGIRGTIFGMTRKNGQNDWTVSWKFQAENFVENFTRVKCLAKDNIDGDIDCILGTSAGSLFHFTRRNQGQVETFACLQVSTVRAGKGECWAMAANPKKRICIVGNTFGNSCIFNLATREPLLDDVRELRNFQHPVYSMSFSPDGIFLAVGQGSGFLSIFDFFSSRIVFHEKISISSERINDIKFSDDSKLVAACCWDQKIYLSRYGGTCTWKFPRKLTGNSSSPVAVLFSAGSGEFLVSCSKDSQILFFSTTTGQRISSTFSMRDVHWQEGWSLMMGWPVVGIWDDPSYDQTDINCVHQRKDSLVTGDDFGNVKLFKYPCSERVIGGGRAKRAAHYGAVTRVSFVPDGSVLTVGGIDGSLAVWRIKD